MNGTAAAAGGGKTGSLELEGVLVRPDWLEAHLRHPALRVVDLRDSDAYGRSRLPGAVHLDLAELGTARPGLDNVLLAADDFAELMKRLGISADTAVVAYDDQWGLAAARLLWALHFYGHDEVSVLDGGWDRWQEEGRPVTDAESAPRPGTFRAVPRPELGATLDWLADRVREGHVALLDTRTAAEFEGGHLPGATSWDWFNAVPAGSWDVARDPDGLRSEWEALDITPDREVVVYCRSGMRAAHTYVALRHAGFPRVRLYDGSWQEWSLSGEEAGP